MKLCYSHFQNTILRRGYFRKERTRRNILKHLEISNNPKKNSKKTPEEPKPTPPVNETRVPKKVYQRVIVRKSEIEEYISEYLRQKKPTAYYSGQPLPKPEPLPVSSKLGPYVVEKLIPNKTYYWCGCGLSKTEPFCDGSHQDSLFKMVKFKVEEVDSTNVKLCGCKRSTKKPFCDCDICVKLEKLEEVKKAMGIKE